MQSSEWFCALDDLTKTSDTSLRLSQENGVPRVSYPQQIGSNSKFQKNLGKPEFSVEQEVENDQTKHQLILFRDHLSKLYPVSSGRLHQVVPRDGIGCFTPFSADEVPGAMTESISRKTPKSLILRLCDARDRDAWDQFVELYAPLIVGFGRRQGLQEADIADLTQEVFREVFRSIRRFEFDSRKGRFRDWLGIITRRRFWTTQRKTKCRPAEELALCDSNQVLDPEADDSGWTEQFCEHVLATALHRIEREFESSTWRVFRQTWIEGLSIEAVSRSSGMSSAAIYMARSRILKRLEEDIRLIAEDLPELNLRMKST